MKYRILSSTLYQQFGLRNGHRHWLFKLSPYGPHFVLRRKMDKPTNLEGILLGIELGGSEHGPSALDSPGRRALVRPICIIKCSPQVLPFTILWTPKAKASS